MTAKPRVLVVPGLNGHPGMLMDAAADLFPWNEDIMTDPAQYIVIAYEEIYDCSPLQMQHVN